MSILFCSVAIIKWKNRTEHEYLVPVGSRRDWSSLSHRPEGKRRHAVSDVVTTEPAGTKRTPNPRRYVLGMNYWEQFTNAVTNFFALACIAHEWDASIVQPYTAHSRLYGLDNLLLDDYINSSDRALDLGLILDPASMDSVLRERGLHSMSTLQDMLRYGDRGLIFLHFVSEKPVHEYLFKSSSTRNFLTSAFQKTGIVDCSNQPELIEFSRLVSSNLNSKLENLTRVDTNHFHLHKYYCINMTHGLTPSELALRAGLGNDNISVIVVNWRGLSNGNEVHSSKGVHLSNRFVVFDNEKCTGHKHLKTFHLEFSQVVQDASKRFMDELRVEDQQFMVVHFRSEKLAFRQYRFPRFMPNCVYEGLQMRDKVLNEVGVTGGGRGLKVLYFGDIGPYGSETCKNCKAIPEMERLLDKYQIELSRFSPSDYNLPQDRGFVATVEMAVMSRASHMILLGGGAFQLQLQVRFERRQLQLPSAGLRNTAVVMCATDQQAVEITQRFSPPQH